MSEVKRAFNPEFINRIDEIVVFHNLDKTHLGQIFDLMVKEISDRLVEQKITISVKKKAREYLIDKGFDEKFGARPLRRLLQKEVEDPLVHGDPARQVQQGDAIEIEIRAEKITFRRQEPEKCPSPVAAAGRSPAGEKEPEKVTT